MLVLSRKVNEKIIIGNNEIIITVVRLNNWQVRIGIEAPDTVKVLRGELVEKPE